MERVSSKSTAAALGMLIALLVAARAEAHTELISGNLLVIKPAKLAKFVSKATFILPTASDNPTASGGSVRFVDGTIGGAGDVTFDLPAAGWKGLGNPAGAKGFKYKGAGSASDPCTVVLIKETVVKAVCKGQAISLTTPALGTVGVAIAVGATPFQYCAAFGGTEIKNTNITLKRKNALKADECVEILPTPTITGTNTPTATFSATLTPTITQTPSATTVPTATSSPLATPTASTTRTPSNTPMVASTNTPTRTRTPTASPTPTATGAGAVCGNGLFESGETCAGCPADCMVGPCTSPSTPTQPFRVNFTPPAFQTASSITVRVGYRDTKVSIPGNGNDATVGARIVSRQSGATLTPNDLNYALRVVYSRAGGINAGRIFVVNFDTCSGQVAATVADFTCVIEGCSSSSGAIDGCSCAVTTP